MGWEHKMERARRLHRPSLNDWTMDGLYETFPMFVQSILGEDDDDDEGRQRRRQRQRQRPSSLYEYTLIRQGLPQHIPVVLDGRLVSACEFARDYESENVPCVITGIPQMDDWTAITQWSLSALENNDTLRNRYFKCGEDDDGRSIKVKLKHFLKYMRRNHDDSPLYVFDSAFDEDRVAKTILTNYKVPSYFSDDLFRLVSERRRPPYRWFLIGPMRSGTTVHIDPLATSAWNTLLYGKKRWVLFPPHVPKHVVKGKGLIRSDEDDEAIHYFMTILPRIKRRAQAVGNHGDYRDFACYEFTQNEGETVFIPHNWWHAVLNMTDTVGITQNFCSPRNFDQVWVKTRTGRKRMAYKWLCQLDVHYPELAQRARAMNARDGFVMKYDPVEVQRREEEEERRRRVRKLQKEQEERRRQEEELLAKEEELVRKERKFLEAETRRQEEEEMIRRRERAIADKEERRRSAETKRVMHSRNNSQADVRSRRSSHSRKGSSKRSRLDSRRPVSP